MVTHSSHQWTPVGLPSGLAVELTRHRYVGSRDGPTVYVQAAQHGQEVNGTETLRRLHDRLLGDEFTLAGELVTVPVADPLTFDHRSYTTHEELDGTNPNMNRVWPGDPTGTIHERLADALWTHAAEADALVDLHTASMETLPHVIYTAGDQEARRLADAFGTSLHLAEPAGEDADPEWHDRSFDGKFRVAAHRAGLPCITPELGDSQHLQESAAELGVAGLLGVLRSVGLLEGEPSESDPHRCRNHLGRSRATESGLFRPTAAFAPGDAVSEGDRLGTLHEPTTYDRLQTATADHDGILYSLTRRGTVTAGDRLAGIGVPVEDAPDGRSGG